MSEHSFASYVAALAVIQIVLLLGAFLLFRAHARYRWCKAEQSERREPHAMPFVKVRDLRKRFGDLAAVDGVSFEVGEGHTLALLGPSGCGKTTILRSIAGLETPEHG